MQSEGNIKSLVSVEDAVITGASACIDQGLSNTTGLNSLVPVDNAHDLDAFAAVVIRIPADKMSQHAVRTGDARLGLLLVCCVLIGPDRVANG